MLEFDSFVNIMLLLIMKTEKQKGRLISFEGIDGSGKTTQIALLSRFLDERGIEHIVTREPGGTQAGDYIREILINSAVELSIEAELLLIEASRAQIVREVIVPHIHKGVWVIMDRYFDATIAYQVYGRGMDYEICSLLNKFSTSSVVPDLTFLLDIDPAEGLRRKRLQAPDEQDRFEKEDIAFFQKVREGYHYIRDKCQERVVSICGDSSADEIAGFIKNYVMRLIYTDRNKYNGII